MVAFCFVLGFFWQLGGTVKIYLGYLIDQTLLIKAQIFNQRAGSIVRKHDPTHLFPLLPISCTTCVNTFRGQCREARPGDEEEEVMAVQQKQQWRGLYPRRRGVTDWLTGWEQYGLKTKIEADSGFLFTLMMDEPNILRRRGLQVRDTDGVVQAGRWWW